MTKNVSKTIASVLFVLVATVALCFGVMSFNGATEKVNADTPVVYENTYLTGFRGKPDAKIMRFYWRIDGESLGYKANDVLAKVAVDYTSGGKTAQRNINLQYTTASTEGVTGNLGGTSDRRRGDCATNHPCIYINISPDAVNGDTFTIPAGTVLDNKYILTQDYTLTFNGTNWLFTEESAIPLEITGFRTGTYDSKENIYNLRVYGGKLLDDYYVTMCTLNAAMSVEYIPAGGEKTTKTIAVKPDTVTCVNRGDIKTSALLLQYGGNFNEGDVLIIKKGTKCDNWAIARDYKLTKTATDWTCELSSNETDPTISLSIRNGGAKYINLFCGTTMNFDYVAYEQLNKNAVIYKNGNPCIVAVNALAMSGANRSFVLEAYSNFANGDILKVPAGFVVAGYKTDKDYMFKWNGSAWSVVSCDGVHHTFADEHTCHDRTCDCGYVEKATTEHTFAAGTHECVDRSCTVCGDTVKGIGHKWPTSDSCEKTCTVCGVTEGVHTWNDGEVTTPATCTAEGVKTFTCTICKTTKTEKIAKADHTIAEGAKTCSVCGYRIPYTADDLDEILASGKLNKYTYSDFHADDAMSEMGHIYNSYTDGVKYGNTFLLNTNKLESKKYEYVEGHENYADMMVGLSLNVSAWAGTGRSGYVYLAAHENGSWGIGFMFSLVEGNPNLRIVYKSADDEKNSDGSTKSWTNTFVAAQTIDMQLNKAYYFELGVIKNDDGSIFAFAIKDGELFMSGTLTAKVLEDYKYEANHNGIGGAASIVFNGNTATPSIAGTMCDKTHKYPEQMFDCKDYKCEICGAVKAHTADHDWGEATVVEAGTCTVKDKMSATCKVCGEKTEYDGNFNHQWDKENPITVTAASCGGVDAVVKYKCKLCEAESENITLEGTGIEGEHNFEVRTIKEATCTEAGLVKIACSKCGYGESEEERPIDANNHKHVKAENGKAASCTENGIKDHFVCSDCNKKLVKNGEAYTAVTEEELVIKATGHDYENGVCKNCNAKDPDYVAPADNGCKSDVSSVAVLMPLLAVAVVILKKKQNYGKQ